MPTLRAIFRHGYSPRVGTKTSWFGPQWFWPEQTPTFDTDVLQRDLPLDAQGRYLARRRSAFRIYPFP